MQKASAGAASDGTENKCARRVCLTRHQLKRKLTPGMKPLLNFGRLTIRPAHEPPERQKAPAVQMDGSTAGKKDKHFLVTKVIEPLVAGDNAEWVEIEAVFSRATQRVLWRDLQNEEVWKQGWV